MEMDLPEDLAVLKIEVKKLSEGCPMRDPLPGCPLSAVRELPEKERIEVVEEMSMEELQRIVQHHSICMGTRH